MTNPRFRLEVSYSDVTGDPVAAYLRIREGTVARTTEISEGLAFADYRQVGAFGYRAVGAVRRGDPKGNFGKGTRTGSTLSPARGSQGDDLRLIKPSSRGLECS